MLTNSSVLALAINGLQDPRCFGSLLMIHRLLTVPKPDGHYRLYHVVPDPIDPTSTIETPITTLDEFYTHVQNSDGRIVPASFGSRYHSGTQPVLVYVDEIRLHVGRRNVYDQEFVERYGASDDKARRLQMCLAYLNDNDTQVPLKVTNVTFC